MFAAVHEHSPKQVRFAFFGDEMPQTSGKTVSAMSGVEGSEPNLALRLDEIVMRLDFGSPVTGTYLSPTAGNRLSKRGVCGPEILDRILHIAWKVVPIPNLLGSITGVPPSRKLVQQPEP